MLATIGLMGIVLAAVITDAEADFVVRVENTELIGSGQKPIPRIERDLDGSIIRLRLSRMQISVEEFAVIGRMTTLRSLDLYRSNLTDANLRQLHKLTHLEGMNLTETAVTDDAIDEIIKFESLKSLCLGGVAITPAAVARLKEEHFRMRGRRLSLGYTQRK